MTRPRQPNKLADGLVICRFGQHYEVEDMITGQSYQCVSRSAPGALVPGDTVDWQMDSADSGVIISRHERNNVLERADNFGRIRPIAANIDQMLITLAVQPEPQPGLIDRYLVAAHLLGIRPLIVFNKIDLLRDKDQFKPLLDVYRALDYAMIFTTCSRHQPPKTGQLGKLIQAKTNIVVGQSGVGKSSLINTLLPGASLATGQLSSTSGEGRHTTTHARLLHLPDGGRLIDSPGIRDFALWHINMAELQAGFVEIQHHATECRFRNCQHNSEPCCAVNAAVECGTISTQRIKSFKQIRATLPPG